MGQGQGPLAWVLKEWGWTRQGEGVLGTADGNLDLNQDGDAAIKSVATKAWVDWMWNSESRVQREDDYKERLEGRQPMLRAHQNWMVSGEKAEGASKSRIAWMSARCGKQASQEGARGPVCRCGHLEPTRYHWAWECPFTGGPADRRAPPRSESEKRLCVPLVQRPIRGRDERDESPLQGIRQEVAKLIGESGVATIATDGGAMGGYFDERVASFGVAVGSKRVRGRVGGMDQTAYKAEAWALYKVLRSIQGLRGTIWIIIDNQAVQREAEARRLEAVRGRG